MALLLAYAAAGRTLFRGVDPFVVAARRNGLAGGLLVGAAWPVVLAAGELLKSVVLAPLAAARLVPIGVAVLAGRVSRDARTATQAAACSRVVGGLLVLGSSSSR